MSDKKKGWDCDQEECTSTVKDGPLYRVNPKGQKGIFMCTPHARQANQTPTEPRIGA